MLETAKYQVTKLLMTFMGPADFGSETHSERLRRQHKSDGARSASNARPKSAPKVSAASGDYQI